jgi:uncharacterized membrane protein YhaH (DUF805 family)
MENIDWKYLFTDVDGRINRQLWWIGVGVLFAVWLVSGFIFGNEGLIPFVMGVLILLAGICLHIKRCHDRGKSGWWCLLLLIPVVGTIWAIVDLGVLEGTPGQNAYGPDPLKALA